MRAVDSTPPHLASLALLFAITACSDTALPTPTETGCPDPDPQTLTWDTDDTNSSFTSSARMKAVTSL